MTDGANTRRRGKRAVFARFGWLDRINGSLALAGAGAGVICAPFITRSDGHINDGWFAGQIAGVLIATTMPSISVWRSKRAELTAAEREIEARTQTRLEMNEALDPIVRTLGASAGRDVIGLRKQVLSLVTKTAAEIVGPDQGTRSCYFAAEAEPKRLIPTEYHAGRLGSPRSTFVAGTEDGDAAVAMVESGGSMLCVNTDTDPPPGWNNKIRDYKTFISVAVVAGDAAYGMLTVDALHPGDLEQRDVDLLTVMAGLVAVAMGLEH